MEERKRVNIMFTYFPDAAEIAAYERDPDTLNGNPVSLIKEIKESGADLVSIRFSHDECRPYADGVYFMTFAEWESYYTCGGGWAYVPRVMILSEARKAS